MLESNYTQEGDRIRQFLTLFAIIGTFVVNTLSNFYPLNGLNIGTLSNTVFAQVQIIPASYAFIIWGLIYIGLFALGIYQIRPSQRQNPDLRKIGYLLIWACGAQAIWVFFFLSRWFAWSNLAMFAILVPLIWSYLALGIGQRRVSNTERWCVHYPISLYLGWITVASIVNVALALDFHNWSGWGVSPTLWTVKMMVASTAIATFVILKRRDLVFPGVIIWALVAIAQRQASQPEIAYTGVASTLLLVMLIVWQYLVKRK